MTEPDSKFVRLLKTTRWVLVYLILIPALIHFVGKFSLSFAERASLCLSLIGLVSFKIPFQQIGLYCKTTGVSAIIGGLVAYSYASSALTEQDNARLAELREIDPAAYLVELKDKDRDKWLRELTVLAPDKYAVEMQRQKAAQKVEAKKRFAASEKKRWAENTKRLAAEVENIDGAWAYMQLFVKERLKSPSSADFPFGGARHVTSLGSGRYKVRSHVDSQNSFGANTRTKFEGIIVELDGRWKLESLNFY